MKSKRSKPTEPSAKVRIKKQPKHQLGVLEEPDEEHLLTLDGVRRIEALAFGKTKGMTEAQFKKEMRRRPYAKKARPAGLLKEFAVQLDHDEDGIRVAECQSIIPLIPWYLATAFFQI